MEATIETPQDIEKNPAGVVRRWLLELKLADKREADWRKKAQKAWDRYRQKDAKKHSFNILWSNTETLRPAIYNSLPSPDVRRRYKDADPIGKACSEVLARSLEYGLDTTDFDAQIKETVLDLLLPGRGVARVRYVPSLRQVGVSAETHTEGAEQHEAGGEALEGDSEELEWEQTPIEHVQWDDFRMGAGKEWCEVPWIAFRHRMTREELIAKFPECGEVIPLDSTDDSDVKAEQDSTVQDMFKTAEVWEIWNKDTREVIFIASGYKEAPCLTLSDPLNLQGFWPTPRPLYAIEDSASTVPVPLYELYREQADELDRLTYRINKLVDGLKLRGVYDATISEMSEVMKGQDNDLIAAKDVTRLLETKGGLASAIWFMPIEQAASVLTVLYQQREAAKQVIYEITGISDILRGATNASETATAQQIKANWGSSRLKRLQAEVSRYIRDLLRIQAEIIGERFQPETLATMTGLQFMTAEQKQQAMMQAQGQPTPQLPPSWDEIIAVLRDDKQRTFKVDVETDSTVAASVESDMQGLKDVLGAIAQTMQAFGPAVQQGALPVEAVKEILLTITRRAKMGNAVEDALDKIQQPKPQQGEQQQPDHSVEVEQVKQQAETQREQMRMQMDAQKGQAAQAHALQLEQIKQQAETEREMMRLQADREIRLMLAKIEEQKAVEVAEINSATTLESNQIAAANQASEAE
jgi:hypothetical protein